jgi:tetratricopeptide (TPR) repeat protein
MDDRAGSTFNPRTFLAKVGSGRTQTRYGKDEPIFAQGDVADAVFRAGKVGPADIWETYRAAAVLDGPNLEYVVDLLRRVSRDVCDPALLKELTEAHLRLLVDQANGAHGTSAADFRAIRRARRIARRALEVWERAHVPVDPDIRADVHLAYGSTFARPLKTDLATAIERYVIALQLKRAANESDVARLEDLLEQMLDHANMKSIAAQFLGGLGMAVRDLRAAYEAAIVVGREDLIVRSGLTLAEAYRGVGQPTLAEPLLRSLLDGFDLEPGFRRTAEVGLAAAASEQFRFPEALAVLEPLYDAGMDDLHGLICLGNCLRETGDLVRARDVFQAALTGLPRRGENEVPLSEIHLKTRLGEFACLTGDEAEGLDTIRDALAVAKNAPPILDMDLHRTRPPRRPRRSRPSSARRARASSWSPARPSPGPARPAPGACGAWSCTVPISAPGRAGSTPS